MFNLREKNSMNFLPVGLEDDYDPELDPPFCNNTSAFEEGLPKGLPSQEMIDDQVRIIREMFKI